MSQCTLAGLIEICLPRAGIRSMGHHNWPLESVFLQLTLAYENGENMFLGAWETGHEEGRVRHLWALGMGGRCQEQ